MSEMCAPIVDELLGVTVLSLSNVASPTYAPTAPVVFFLSSDLVLSSSLLLSHYLYRLLLLGSLFFLMAYCDDKNYAICSQFCV